LLLPYAVPEGRAPEGRDPEGRDPEDRDPVGRDPEDRDPEGLWLEMLWDGLFFASGSSGKPKRDVRGLWVGCAKGLYYCYFPMPFRKAGIRKAGTRKAGTQCFQALPLNCSPAQILKSSPARIPSEGGDPLIHAAISILVISTEFPVLAFACHRMHLPKGTPLWYRQKTLTHPIVGHFCFLCLDFRQ
jgi:hypothetical protein